MKKIFLTLLVFALFVAACANPAALVTPTAPAPTAVPPTVVPPTPVPEDDLTVRGAAMDALAKILGVPMSQVKLVSSEAVEWTDSCLGIIYINAICAAVVTPGYRLVLEADGVQYVYHTNTDGTLAVAAQTEGLEISEELQRAVRQTLANTLGIDYTQSVVVSATLVEWPDSCLGVTKPGIDCLQVITPGALVIVKAGGIAYEYHTNADGSIVVPVPTGALGAAGDLQLAVRVTLAKTLGVDIANVIVDSVTLVAWPDSCLGLAQPGMTCLQVITPGALIVVKVNGIAYEYHTNADGSVIVPATIALTWHREGGIAGFCDDLVVYLAGEVNASTCAGKVTSGNLTTDELVQLHQWVTTFSPVAWNQSDAPPGSADAMTIELTLNGIGAVEAAEADQQTMTTWSQAVYTRVSTTPVEG